MFNSKTTVKQQVILQIPVYYGIEHKYQKTLADAGVFLVCQGGGHHVKSSRRQAKLQTVLALAQSVRVWRRVGRRLRAGDPAQQRGVDMKGQRNGAHAPSKAELLEDRERKRKKLERLMSSENTYRRKRGGAITSQRHKID
ncbi:hypothetical protein [Alicyclobacillus fodiniaquatilis]|uniref:Uncharacterized protein n=1 Tax=Alicyclobacillus fodiniaquatilis TaxID=1661150 RepID=A0ABW4JGH7_9BACL